MTKKEYLRKKRIQKKQVRMLKTGFIILFVIIFFAGFFLGRLSTSFLSSNTSKNVAVSTDNVIDKKSWNLVLVNSTHPKAKNYVPDLTEVADGYSVDLRIAHSLNSMLTAASEDGVDINITSAYRTGVKQQELFDAKTASVMDAEGLTLEKAQEEAAHTVAVPGTSEHELGLALDLVDASNPNLDETQETTKAYSWLTTHCMEYGFILRYPSDKTDITGIIYEPWHYRYVGKQNAIDITSQGICLEEYLGEVQ